MTAADPRSAAWRWKRRTALSAALLLALTFLVSKLHGNLFALYQVQSQDLGSLVLLSLSLLVASLWMPQWRLPSQLRIRTVALFGVSLVALLAWGTYALMGNYPLSRDEHMVVFDMAVFDRFKLSAPLASAWRPYAQALVPAFLLNDHMPSGLVSSYLPGNALLRLGFSKIADPALFNPLLALVGGAALLDIARRSFGRDDPACWVVLLIYALSAQMLVNAMTAYSMTAHMALNMIWLAAFLRGGRLGHSIAILTGFVATGLHQIAFHPFFVAPFLFWLLREKQWKLLLIYAAAYSTIILWWAYYPIVAAHEVAGSVQQAPDSNLMARVSALLAHRDGNPVALMFLNLLRFVAWQNFALLPLLAASVPVARRNQGLAGALALGILVWLAFIAIVLPYQGHGWGYRYLHPYLGSFALLAGYGYRELKEQLGARTDGMVLGLSGVTIAASIPLLFVATYRFVQPHVALERLIAGQRTEIVLVDTEVSPGKDGRWAPNAVDHVRNLPDLTNRPLRFSSRHLDAVRLARLCGMSPITLVTRTDQRRVGFASNVPEKSDQFDRLVAAAQAKVPGCFRKAQALAA
jgi:hypothetical protein